MQNATAHSTATPVATAKDFICPTLTQSNECCLFHSSTLLEALLRAKAKQRKDERGVAYYELLQAFHRSVLPTFILETGSISKASELLGIHRGTLSRYMGHADIDLEQYVGGGA